MGILEGIKGAFAGNQQQQQETYNPPQGIHPTEALQISRNFNNDDASVGIANITLESKDKVAGFRNKLRGYYLRQRINPVTGESLEPETVRFGAPAMSEEGINVLCGWMEMFNDKSFILSNITSGGDVEIDKICRSFHRTIAASIAFNSENWKVDRSRRDMWVSELTMCFKFNMMRSTEDGERRKLYPTQKNVSSQSFTYDPRNPPNNGNVSRMF